MKELADMLKRNLKIFVLITYNISI